MERVYDQNLIGLTRLVGKVCEENRQVHVRTRLDQTTLETITTFSEKEDGGGTVLIEDPTGQIPPKLIADRDVIERVQSHLEISLIDTLGGVALVMFPRIFGLKLRNR